MRSRRSRRRLFISAMAIVLMFLIFEAVVRLLPPDAVSYEIHNDPIGGQPSQVSGTITDPALIARWRAAMSAHPDRALLDIYLAKWQGTDTCSRGATQYAYYTFTWHGLPVEVVSPAPSCGGGNQISSGGILSWNMYALDPAPQP